VNDFESALRQTLNDHVDEIAGAMRPAPRFEPNAPKPRRSPRSPWILPVLAAAVIAVIAIGTAVATNALSRKLPISPIASPSPGPIGTTPTSSPTPTTPSRSPASTETTTPPISGTSPATVSLGGAAIVLPAGWVARDYSQYLSPGQGTPAAGQWCISPASLVASTKPNACPLTLATIPDDGNEVDVDAQSGWMSNSPQYCAGLGAENDTEQSGDRSFGGRIADWRRWQITCALGTSHDVEQYVVASAPGFILFSDQVTTQVDAAMTQLVANATLPAQTLPLRFEDYGYIRSAVTMSDGIHITLDRIVRGVSYGNNNPQTYDYVIPTDMYDAATARVGSLVYLHSNGTTIRDFYLDPSH
jgi:hypothetical protein